MFYIYVLYSPSSDIHYVGYSEDPYRRLIEHNTKEEGTFSSKHKPWLLSAVFEAGSKQEAIIAERFIKKQRSAKLIAKLLDPNFVLDGKLANLVRVPDIRD
ncbi:MAG: GIY-YIG nuclease family protein [Bacteroidetes bacterium]|nr:GIY-YIG nuclease family protein [Bacteroidota bacterium]